MMGKDNLVTTSNGWEHDNSWNKEHALL